MSNPVADPIIGSLQFAEAKIQVLKRPKYIDAPGLRFCRICKEQKQPEEFHWHVAGKILRRECKRCTLAGMVIRNKLPDVAEKRRANNRRYYQSQKGRDWQKKRRRTKPQPWRNLKVGAP